MASSRSVDCLSGRLEDPRQLFPEIGCAAGDAAVGAGVRHPVRLGLLRHLRRAGGELAVDLGTANTVVFVRGEGIVLFEPSVIAIDERSDSVVAVGEEAKRMIGRTPASIRATRPLRHGVIADFEVTEQMLRHFLRRAIGRRFARPRMVLCVPSGLTGVERDAVEKAALAAGAGAVYPIEEPIAAAIGADLAIEEPFANLVVDIGGGTTEVAVISLGSMVVWRSLRSAGFEMDDAIVTHVKREHGLEIGEAQAEQAKLAIGGALPGSTENHAEVAGRDLLTGQLRRVSLTAEEVRLALEGTVAGIVDAVIETLEQTPPELSADIADRGITLVGGGGMLRGLPDHLQAMTGLPTSLVDEPLTCVALGAGRCLDQLDTIARSATDRRN
jgi:rod shape-determining protein MreB and related proteins